LGGLAAGAGFLAARTEATGIADGHAAGSDVAPAGNPVALISRRPGDAPAFSASLDRAALKATSGGWAREITSRQLPIATDLAAAHLFLNPGGAREMHWHNSAEWAYVIAGQAQATVVDPEGICEVFNVAAGDLWYFAPGHAHSIQTIGDQPCHAILVFNDGLYSEHGTFGITDWISRLDPAMLARNFGLSQAAFEHLPQGETYIMQGDVLAVDGPEARATRLLDHARSHVHSLLKTSPAVVLPGGTIHVASAAEFPASAVMTGQLVRLAPSAMQELHWHPEASEIHYVISGRLRITMLSPDKHLAVAELAPGDCAYVPLGCGHMVQSFGDEPAEYVAVLNSGRQQTATLSDWVAHAPAHLLANNLRVDASKMPAFRGRLPIIAKGD
jgi:oxalate decarboxylase